MLSWQIGIASAPKAEVAGYGGKVRFLQTAPAHVSLTGKAPAWKAGSNRVTGVQVQVLS